MANRSAERQKKRGRGRQPQAKVGDYAALLEKLHAEEDKFEVELANNIGALYEMMLQLALGKISPTKDQVKAAEYMIKKAEAILDQHYEDNDIEPADSPAKDSVAEQEDKVSAAAMQLVSMTVPEEFQKTADE